LALLSTDEDGARNHNNRILWATSFAFVFSTIKKKTTCGLILLFSSSPSPPSPPSFAFSCEAPYSLLFFIELPAPSLFVSTQAILAILSHSI
jgi:hypothetical protein